MEKEEHQTSDKSRRKPNNEPNIHVCKKCGSGHQSAGNLKKHMELHDRQAGITDKLSCDKCSFQTFYENSLRNHKLNKHDGKVHKTHICSVCESKHQYPSDLKKHMRIHDRQAGISKKLSCDKCSFETFYENSLRHHKLNHQGGEQRKCPYCPYTRKMRSSIKRHLVKEHPGTTESEKYKHLFNETLSCELCGYTTMHKTALYLHEKRHEGSKPHKCQLCDYSCLLSRQLKDHMQSRHSKPPADTYSCSSCSFIFTKYSKLSEHEKTCGKPRKCSKCTTVCFSTESLNAHKKDSHPPELHFHCTQCHHKSSLKRDLELHEMDHWPIAFNDEKKRVYACPECDYSSTKRRSMHKHIVTTHQTGRKVIDEALKTYLCHLCAFRTHLAGSLRVHLRGHAKQTMDEEQVMKQQINKGSINGKQVTEEMRQDYQADTDYSDTDSILDGRDNDPLHNTTAPTVPTDSHPSLPDAASFDSVIDTPSQYSSTTSENVDPVIPTTPISSAELVRSSLQSCLADSAYLVPASVPVQPSTAHKADISDIGLLADLEDFSRELMNNDVTLGLDVSEQSSGCKPVDMYTESLVGSPVAAVSMDQVNTNHPDGVTGLGNTATIPGTSMTRQVTANKGQVTLETGQGTKETISRTAVLNETLKKGIPHLTLSHTKERMIRKCPECDFTTEHARSFRTHVLRHSNTKPQKCDQCDYSCIQPGQLRIHLQKKHGIMVAAGTKKCHICGFQADSWNSLKSHKEEAHSFAKALMYECEKCDYKSKDELGKITHEIIHWTATYSEDGKQVYYCPNCEFSDKTRGFLANHIMAKHHKRKCKPIDHTLPKDVLCDQCAFRTHSLKSLQSHRWRHHRLNNSSTDKTGQQQPARPAPIKVWIAPDTSESMVIRTRGKAEKEVCTAVDHEEAARPLTDTSAPSPGPLASSDIPDLPVSVPCAYPEPTTKESNACTLCELDILHTCSFPKRETDTPNQDTVTQKRENVTQRQDTWVTHSYISRETKRIAADTSKLPSNCISICM